MKNYKVSLSFQCEENWNKMTPVQQGKHCAACNKVVVDFSSMTDTQLIEYLLKNKNTCGKFKPSQLNRTYSIASKTKKTHWPAIAAMLVAGMFSLTSTGLHSAMHGGTIVTTETNPLVSKKVEPDKTKTYFTIKLFDESTNEKILYGTIFIEGLGSFSSNEKGEFLIENNIEKPNFPKTLSITASGPGYQSKVYKILSKYILDFSYATIYLEKFPIGYEQPAGMVAIEEQ